MQFEFKIKWSKKNGWESNEYENPNEFSSLVFLSSVCSFADFFFIFVTFFQQNQEFVTFFQLYKLYICYDFVFAFILIHDNDNNDLNQKRDFFQSFRLTKPVHMSAGYWNFIECNVILAWNFFFHIFDSIFANSYKIY